MHLLIESGKTKTHGVLIENSKIIQEIDGLGLDLAEATEQSVQTYLNEIFKDIAPEDVQTGHWYSAGSAHRFGKLESILEMIFPTATISVENDVIGAGIACFGKEEGIVCILGTGSNSAHIRNGKILQQRGGLGQLVGDEGSGYVLGKRLIHGYLMGLFSESLLKKLRSHLGDEENCKKDLYGSPNQIQKIASYSKLYTELQDDYLLHLAQKEFGRFFKNTIAQYPDFTKHSYGIIGSIGWHFQEQVAQAANKYGITDIHFVQYPLQGLIDHFTIT